MLEKDDTYCFRKTHLDLCKELTPLVDDNILQDIENANINIIILYSFLKYL